MPVTIFGIVPVLLPLLQLSPTTHLHGSEPGTLFPKLAGKIRIAAAAIVLENRSKTIWLSIVAPLTTAWWIPAFAGVFSGEIDGTQTSQPCSGSSVRKSRKNSQAPFITGYTSAR